MFSLCWQPACCRHSWADLAADQTLLRCTFRLHLKHFPAMNSASVLIWKRKSPFQTRGKTILIILLKLFYSLKRQARLNRSRWRRPDSAHEQSTSHTQVKFILYPVRTFPLFDVRPWLTVSEFIYDFILTCNFQLIVRYCSPDTVLQGSQNPLGGWFLPSLSIHQEILTIVWHCNSPNLSFFCRSSRVLRKWTTCQLQM